MQHVAGAGGLPTIEGFEVLEVLGTGGFSTVYSACDLTCGDQVALKVLADANSDHRRFQRECRILEQLSPIDGIVGVRQSTFAVDGRPVIVMDHLSGGTLAGRIAQEPLAPVDVLSIGIRLAIALEFAHRRGVFHRDIKPANVLFDAGGRPAIVDFGIAIADDRRAATVTHYSLSPPYSPPERFRDDDPAGPGAGDIWSLAATLYTALNVMPPFGTTSEGGLAGLVVRVANEPMAPIEREDLPPGFAAVLRHALEKDPADRYHSMEVLAAELWYVREAATRPGAERRTFPGIGAALPDAMSDPPPDARHRAPAATEWWKGPAVR